MYFQYFDPKKAALSAFNVSIFPLLFFYSFFYYTDVGSTFMVLLMYCLHLDGRDWAASFIGKRLTCVTFKPHIPEIMLCYISLQVFFPLCSARPILFGWPLWRRSPSTRF
jgi:hypothetical protein